MPNWLFANALATLPSGNGVGVRITQGALQASALAGSFQVAKLAPTAGIGPTVPPKSTDPPTADVKAATAFAPLVTTVGYAKFHHLKPTIGLPAESLPFAVAL